jgi:hypothetical protein
LHCQTAQDSGEGSQNGGSRKARRPLEQEPAMAARIMIEDCLALLLDVQDVDRLFAASPSASSRLPNCRVVHRGCRLLMTCSGWTLWSRHHAFVCSTQSPPRTPNGVYM